MRSFRPTRGTQMPSAPRRSPAPAHPPASDQVVTTMSMHPYVMEELIRQCEQQLHRSARCALPRQLHRRRRGGVRQRAATCHSAHPAMTGIVGRLLTPDLCCSCVGRSSPGQPSRLHPGPGPCHTGTRASPRLSTPAILPAAARRPAAANYPLACQPSRYPSARPGMTHRDEQRMLPTDQKHPYRVIHG